MLCMLGDDEENFTTLTDTSKLRRPIQDFAGKDFATRSGDGNPNEFRFPVGDSRTPIVNNYLQVVRIIGVQSLPQSRVLAPFEGMICHVVIILA